MELLCEGWADSSSREAGRENRIVRTSAAPGRAGQFPPSNDRILHLTGISLESLVVMSRLAFQGAVIINRILIVLPVACLASVEVRLGLGRISDLPVPARQHIGRETGVRFGPRCKA